MSESVDLEQYVTRPIEGLLQFSDVFGYLPVNGGAQPLPTFDFDAHITAKVGNSKHFSDAEYEIKAWPKTLGNYAAVLLDQLRGWQQSFVSDLGGTALVAVINDAPRDESYEPGQNGEPFYLAITEHGVEIFAQSQFLSGLAARGLIRALYKIPNSQGPWGIKTQFRSKDVARTRDNPASLHPVDLSVIPDLPKTARLAYFDTFGNVRIEVPKIEEVSPLLEADEVRLIMNGIELPERVSARGIRTLDDIDLNRLGIYHNPDDADAINGPAYLEFARKLLDPNDPNADHGYRALETHAGSIGIDLTRLTGWDEVEFEIQGIGKTLAQISVDQRATIGTEVLTAGTIIALETADENREQNAIKFGLFLKEQRLARGISLRGLARLTDLSASYIGILEKGVNPLNDKPINPTLAVILKIAGALQLNIKYLLELNGYRLVGATES